MMRHCQKFYLFIETFIETKVELWMRQKMKKIYFFFFLFSQEILFSTKVHQISLKNFSLKFHKIKILKTVTKHSIDPLAFLHQNSEA